MKYVGEREKTFTTVIYHQHMKKRIPAWEVITDAMCAKILHRKMTIHMQNNVLVVIKISLSFQDVICNAGN